MLEFLTAAKLLECCVFGFIGNRADHVTMAAVRRLADNRVPQNHDVLKALHAAFIGSLERMVKAVDALPYDVANGRSQKALSTCLNNPRFKVLNLSDPQLPTEAFEAQLSFAAGAERCAARVNATEQVVALLQDLSDNALTEQHIEIFRSGAGTHLSWAEYFELYWREQIKTNQRVAAIIQYDRGEELRRFAEDHSDRLAEIQSSLAVVTAELGDFRAENQQAHQQQSASLARIEQRVAWTPTPFMQIAGITRLYARTGDGVPAPSKEEYAQGLVNAPAIAGDVEQALLQGGAAIVFGDGASGKTTLAITLSYRPALAGRTAYYVDLTGMIESGSLTQSITTCDRADAVLILDNAHLAPDIAEQCVAAWNESQRAAPLLVLARLTKKRTNNLMPTTRLEAMDLPQFTLKNGTDALAGAFDRLYRRQHGNAPEPVPASVLADWLALFQGDLLMFSAAVAQRLKDRNWDRTLRAEDARQYVQFQYLKKYPAAREDLINIACLHVIELALPGAQLATDVDELVSNGIILVGEREATGSASYRFVHPGIARLILDAVELTDPEISARRIALLRQADARSKVVICASLASKGLDAESVALRDSLWIDGGDDWPLATVPVHFWGGQIRSALKAGIVTVDQLDARGGQWIAASPGQLVDCCVLAPLGSLPGFLELLAEVAPTMHASVLSVFADPKHSPALTDALLKTTPTDLLKLLESALNAPAGDSFWHWVQTALADDDGEFTRLTEQMLASDIATIVKFLEVMRPTRPAVATIIELRIIDDLAWLADKCLTPPQDGLVKFFKFVGDGMPAFDRSALLAELLSDGRAAQRQQWAIGAMPQPLSAAVDAVPELGVIFTELDFAAWTSSIASRHLGSPTWFAKFDQKCSKYGRPELSAHVAERLLRTATARDFFNKKEAVNAIYALSHILRCGAAAGENVQIDFLRRCIPPAWLDQQYPSPGTLIRTLAGSTWAFATNPSATVRQYLARPSLLSALSLRKQTAQQTPVDLCYWLQSFGSCSLLFTQRPLIKDASLRDWPMIGKALAYRGPNSDGSGIQHEQAALWAGLHEWLFWRQTSYKVDANLAAGILADFLAAEAQDAVRANQRLELIAWLEQARDERWVLPIPKQSLAATAYNPLP